MNILIYGSNGWIGSQFLDILNQHSIKYVEGTSRVDDTREVIKEINDVSPTHIISFIGRTHGKINDNYYSTIDYLEQEGKLTENLRDNLYSPMSLAIICKLGKLFCK